MATTEVELATKKPIVAEIINTSSIELRRNAKGIIEMTVKVYDNPTEAAKKAATILSSLQKKFPYPKA